MVFKKDYIIRKGTTFLVVILLDDIYIELDSAETYTTEGGIKYIPDDTEKYSITVTLSENNTIVTLTMSATDTTSIINSGKFEFAIDISLAGIVQTILEGDILVKDDISKID